jgi:hypothetical protein
MTIFTVAFPALDATPHYRYTSVLMTRVNQGPPTRGPLHHPLNPNSTIKNVNCDSFMKILTTKGKNVFSYADIETTGMAGITFLSLDLGDQIKKCQ